ncbi:MAG: ribonuclease D [Rickettsiaceae bacterium]|nr:ribonuclease D [Rickettsiaceae bacterium]
MESILFQGDIPQDLIRSGDIAIDTETMGLNLSRDRLCLLQFSYGDGVAYLVKFDKNYESPNLKKLLSDPNRGKIFHFARFDMAAIELYLGVKMTNIFCTKIASKLVRTYTEYHGLKDLCRDLISVNISKAQQTTYWGSAELTKEQIEYAGSDVYHLHALRSVLSNMLEKENRLDLANEIFKFLPTRVSLDIAGWVDQDIFAH